MRPSDDSAARATGPEAVACVTTEGTGTDAD